jgi:hypothetical protein
LYEKKKNLQNYSTQSFQIKQFFFKSLTNASDFHSGSGQSSQSRLSTWAWSLGLVATGGSQFDVKSVDSVAFANLSYVLGRQHSSIWRRLVSVGFYFHTTSDTGNCFSGIGKVTLND